MSTEYAQLSAKYNQLSADERGKIEVYYEIGVSISQIARNLSRSKSTICEEIRRGKYKGKYFAHIAQNRAIKRRKESHKHTKWRNIELLRFIEKHLKLRWSPEIISHELRKNGIIIRRLFRLIYGELVHKNKGDYYENYNVTKKFFQSLQIRRKKQYIARVSPEI